MSDERTWEHQDPQADAYLIDPGPVREGAVSRKAEKAARRALIKSTPPPIKKGKGK